MCEISELDLIESRVWKVVREVGGSEVEITRVWVYYWNDEDNVVVFVKPRFSLNVEPEDEDEFLVEVKRMVDEEMRKIGWMVRDFIENELETRIFLSRVKGDGCV